MCCQGLALESCSWRSFASCSSAAELDYQREIHELRLQLELLSRDADLRLNHALNQQCTALERYYESILAAHEQAAQEEKATACARLQARLEAELQAQLQVRMGTTDS